jgi:hypothetical protein
MFFLEEEKKEKKRVTSATVSLLSSDRDTRRITSYMYIHSFIASFHMREISGQRDVINLDEDSCCRLLRPELDRLTVIAPALSCFLFCSLLDYDILRSSPFLLMTPLLVVFFPRCCSYFFIISVL